MPTLTDLQQRYPKQQSFVVRQGDEVLVVDSRARMTPCNFVEQKFRAVLSSGKGSGGGKKLA
jgi:hypothetical protein